MKSKNIPVPICFPLCVSGRRDALYLPRSLLQCTHPHWGEGVDHLEGWCSGELELSLHLSASVGSMLIKEKKVFGMYSCMDADAQVPLGWERTNGGNFSSVQTGVRHCPRDNSQGSTSENGAVLEKEQHLRGVRMWQSFPFSSVDLEKESNLAPPFLQSGFLIPLSQNHA